MLGRPRRLVVFRAQSLWCKAPSKRRGLQLGCGDHPEHLTGSGDRPQGLPKCTGSVTTLKGCHLFGFGDRPQGLPKCTGSVTTPKVCHLYGFGDCPQGSCRGYSPWYDPAGVITRLGLGKPAGVKAGCNPVGVKSDSKPAGC